MLSLKKKKTKKFIIILLVSPLLSSLILRESLAIFANKKTAEREKRPENISIGYEIDVRATKREFRRDRRGELSVVAVTRNIQ